ncbi:MAG: Cys-tRNA(Pro) deacylase [Clostridiales bacterium]|nr:Cys-tRNA(Pro) deacylase [Clostridiales bacterium]
MAKKEKEVKTNAMRILDKNKVKYESHTYECTEFTDGGQIADLLGIDHSKVYKTLVTVGKSKNYYVFVLPIDDEIDFKKAAKVVGEKSLEMLPLKELTPLTGYVRGGCTSVGMKKQFPTVFNDTIESLEKVVVSGGQLGLQLELAPADLIRVARGSVGDVIVKEG